MSNKRKAHFEKKKVVIFTIAYDPVNMEYARKMINSLKKFHPDIPIMIFGEKEVNQVVDPSPDKLYRLYARFGEELSKEYELVINIDADSVVTGSLDHIINDKEYDIGCVLNNNLIDQKLTIWDIPWEGYVNAGFVAIRGERVWKWWNMLNQMPYFNRYQFREQDMLNIIAHYGDTNCKIFDYSSKWHGLVHKGQWPKFILKGDKIVLPKTEGVCEEDKEIVCIHWAGGRVPNKLNFDIYFQPEVVKRLKELTND